MPRLWIWQASMISCLWSLGMINSLVAKKLKELEQAKARACRLGSKKRSQYLRTLPGTNQAWMGSHHRHVAILVPDDKLDCFELWKKFCSDKNGLSFYPGPVLPHRTDSSPVSSLRVWKLLWAWLSKVNNGYYEVGMSSNRNNYFRHNFGIGWVDWWIKTTL